MLSKHSKIKTCPGTAAVNIADSLLGFSDSFYRKTDTNTPPSRQTRSLAFSILPNLDAELWLPETVLVTKFKVTKENGDSIHPDAQISAIQAWALFCWDRISVKIGSEVFRNEFPICQHAMFQKLLLQYTPQERETMHHSFGWRDDNIGMRSANTVDVDPTVTCDCRKCFCAIKQMPQNHGSANANPVTYTDLVALPDKTVAQIAADHRERKKYNPGLYYRARMLRASSTSEVETIVPMRYLSGFFDIWSYYPQRQLIQIDMTLADDKSILCLKNGMDATQKYTLTITDSYIRAHYCRMLPELHSRWTQSIAQLGLRRNIQLAKDSTSTVVKGAVSAKMTNIFSFGSIPQSIVIFFTESTVEHGDFSNTKFCYKKQDLKSLKIWKSGKPIELNNVYESMDLSSHHTQTQYFLHDEMIKLYGPKAVFESVESQWMDLNMICLSLSPNPRIGDDYGVTTRGQDRLLSFVQGASLELDIQFNTPVASDLILHVIGYFDCLVHFNEYGELVKE